MTTQTMSGPRRHVRHDSAGTTLPFRQQAPSPTLTNPDMILPDYDDANGVDVQNSPPHMWNHHTQRIDTGFHFTDMLQSGDVQLTTPIIYGNGTMLSDIGEVTEVESNAGGPLKRIPSARTEYSNHDAALRSSPTMKGHAIIKRSQNDSRERRSSIESTSTITSQDRNRTFIDLDDTVSMDDSNFQGDDEESVTDSCMEDPSMPDDGFGTPQDTLSRERRVDDRYSTSSISRRAEQILANAKRRLTTMEGNLTRARTFSYSSVSDGSTPSPIRRPGSVIRHATPHNGPSHSRNASDNSPAETPKASVFPQRSASALGASGGYRQPQSAQGDATINRAGKSIRSISHHPLDTALEPLCEVDTLPDERSVQESGQPSPLLGAFYDPANITRSASAAQMRDIQDQMKGLKGKIYTLREQAAADSMKRRSLQSLRTPSPFTHAMWSGSSSETRVASAPDPHAPTLGSPFQSTFPSDQVGVSHGGDTFMEAEPRQETATTVGRYGREQTSLEADVQNDKPENPEDANRQKMERNAVASHDEDHLATENGDFNEDLGEVEDNISESGDSLYHDTRQQPVSHEDREDAFDYQHFFLHSAMGTLSRQGLYHRDSLGSISSTDSVETTRAQPAALQRRSSIDTMTSVDSFMTATEGRSSRTSAAHAEEETTNDNNPYYDPVDTLDSSRNAVHVNGHSSGSDDSSNAQVGYKRGQPQSLQKLSSSAAAVRHGLQRPSISSFESTGTNRSFPLVSKSRMSGANSTPRDSPDSQLRLSSSLRDRNSVHSNSTSRGGAYSPTVVALSKDDQALVDHLVIGFNQCVGGLTDGTEHPETRDTYRKRIEAARRILAGESELP